MENMKFGLTKTFLGRVCISASAFCLYMTTVSIRWAKTSVELDSTFFVFARFALGFIVICSILAVKRRPLKPRNWWLLLGRAFSNVAAVFCFFKAVSLTSAAEGNILNMTYPLFIAVFFFLFQKGKKDYPAYFLTLVAFFGVWLVISPQGFALRMENLWGLASGFFGAIAVTILNFARKFNDTDTILFFMFGIGTLLIGIFFPQHLFIPTLEQAKYLAIAAIFGVLGQYLLTLGFKYVTAVEGGVISSSRILIAAILGPYIVSDPALGLSGWFGALLIFGTNVYLTIRDIGIQQK
ncbi:MAG: DMT family transporter [Deltaproteobacteria bacterium]|nr:DMT family transporter [Deltaproteobacteria bacterium]MBT6501817.1 DMT family transporter [Deltaproteobacteria bacterium]